VSFFILGTLYLIIGTRYFFAGAAGAPAFGFLAPYLLLRCLRASTPDVSKAPRTMW
jgi:hypothetical protein